MLTRRKMRKVTSFLYFAFFSKSIFDEKIEVLPLFLQNGWADRAGVRVFFVSQNLVLKTFSSLYKMSTLGLSERPSVFCSSFWI